MDITASLLNEMFSGFNTVFNKSVQATPVFWNRIAMDVKSTGSDETYGWLSGMPQMREWLGERYIKAVQSARYTLENRKFESTIRVRREDIEDDRLGVYSPQINMMAYAAATHPDELVFEVLKKGFETECYDGQPYFDTDHPVLDKDNVEQSVSNFQGGAGTPWFLLDVSRPVKPLVFQTRIPYRMQSLTKDDDGNVFMRDEYLYGVRARVNAGFGLWQYAYGSKQTLDAANYAAARAAMQAMRYDGGRVMGVVPTLLVVPPDLEGAGRALLTAEELTGGGTNVWRGSAELLVSPYLQA
ncbi:Mu-like prophage major head subunit gpT [Marinibacterium anthonyi]|nr:Mu-like prophage major head subunit gpT [Marinibacterium anthonyi]